MEIFALHCKRLFLHGRDWRSKEEKLNQKVQPIPSAPSSIHSWLTFHVRQAKKNSANERAFGFVVGNADIAHVFNMLSHSRVFLDSGLIRLVRPFSLCPSRAVVGHAVWTIAVVHKIKGRTRRWTQPRERGESSCVFAKICFALLRAHRPILSHPLASAISRNACRSRTFSRSSSRHSASSSSTCAARFIPART